MSSKRKRIESHKELNRENSTVDLDYDAEPQVTPLQGYSPVKEPKKVSVSLILAFSVLSIVIVLLGILNFMQYNNCKDYENQVGSLKKKSEEHVERIIELQNEVKSLKTELSDVNEKYKFYDDYVDFYVNNFYKVEMLDNNIVFVIEGFGNNYYTYDQMEIVTQGLDEYEYWAYNKEYAIYLGYEAWK